MTATEPFTRPTRASIDPDDWAALCRCAATLHRWAEMCCNHDVDEREDGTVWVRWCLANGDLTRPQRTPNRAAGALKRAARIAQRYGLAIYEQGDPRGPALYLYDPKDPRAHQIHSCYSSIGLPCLRGEG